MCFIYRIILGVVFTSLVSAQSFVQINGNIIMESMTNICGGIKTGKAISGVGEFGVEINHKFGQVKASTLYLNGESPSKFIGDRFGASNIDGYNSFRLYEIWVEKHLLNQTLSIRFGSLIADAEFSVNDLGGLFINSSFGWPAYISANTVNTGPAYFVTAPGIRIKQQLKENQFFQFGIYDGDPFDHFDGDEKITAHGNHWELSKDQGIFSIGEWVSFIGAKNLGTIKLGSWKYTSFDSSSLYYQNARDRYGFYFSSESKLKSFGSNQSINGFFRAGWSPNSIQNTYTIAIDGGITIQNVFESLKDDSFGIGFAFAKIPDKVYLHSVEESLLIPLDYECAIECTYQFQFMNYITIQPDLQWILHPGGSAINENAFVGSIRISHSF